MSGKLINLAYFQEVCLGNRDFSLEIINKFIEDYEHYYEPLTKAVEQANFREVKRIVQQLKSIALVFGASQLVGQIRKIEMASQDKFEEYAPLIREVVATFEQFAEEAREIQAAL